MQNTYLSDTFSSRFSSSVHLAGLPGNQQFTKLDGMALNWKRVQDKVRQMVGKGKPEYET